MNLALKWDARLKMLAWNVEKNEGDLIIPLLDQKDDSKEWIKRTSMKYKIILTPIKKFVKDKSRWLFSSHFGNRLRLEHVEVRRN